MRNRSGPNIEPWETPAKTGLHDDVCPFKQRFGVYLTDSFQEHCKVLLIYQSTSSYKTGFHAKPCRKL